MKKFLSLLLAIVMIVSIFPAQILSTSAATSTYELVTDASKLSVGANVIIVARDSEVALSTTQNSNNRGQTTVSKGDNVIASIGETVQVLTLEAGTTDGTYAFNTGSGYLYAASSSKNYLRTESSLSANSSWSIAIAEDGTATIKAQGTNTRNWLRYNSSSSIFSCYSSGQLDVVLYVLNEGSSDCTHTNTETVEAVSATCTTAGNTAGTKCTDCGAVLEGNETIAALGHTETSEVTAPTCTADGYTTYTCSVCSNERKADNVDATGHTLVDGVCSTCGVEQLNTEKASTIAVGDEVIFVCETALVEMNGFYGTSYAYGTAYTDAPMGVQVWTVSAGYTDGTYAFVNNGVYLAWASGNSAMTTDTLDANSSWTVSFDESGNALIYNSADSTRQLQWNKSSPRFACYALKDGAPTQTAIQIYAVICDHANTTTNTVDATCTEAGSTTVVCDDCGETLSTEEIAALGHNYVDNICSVCGAEFEGDIDTPDVCEHETTSTFITDATCVTAGSTTVICEDCGEAISTEEIPATGVHNYVDGTCSNCGEAEPAEEVKIIFELGDNGDASHKDGSTAATTYTETVEGYTLEIIDGTKMYPSSFDAQGNSCIKLGTSSAAGGFNFTVPDDVTQVVICVAKYKANTSKIEVNGITYNLTNASNDGAYDEITVDTSSSKTVTVTTVSGGYRAMVNSIAYICGETDHTCQWDEGTVTTEATCTTDGVLTYSCTVDGCTVTKTETIEATGHSYVYSETAITCANCDYSAEYTLSTIATAKAGVTIGTDGSGTSDGVTYYIKGIVTYVSGVNVYIEDATGAICVYFSTADDAANIAVGDEILVWDTITAYKSLIETNKTTAQEYVKVSSGNELPSQTVTIADLLADTTNEYLAERVVIENVTIGTINTSGNTALTDADGNTINIYKVSGLSEDINANDTVTVTAIVSTFSGYQLLINPGTAAADVVETVSGEETVVTTVTIEEAKAGTVGEYYQVEGTVTYISGRNVYIQDATGGIVVYLTTDAATTQVGDTVKAYGALKNYYGLLELENVDETNEDFYQILSSGNTVDAQAITLADLAADTTNDYLAEKISLTGVYVSYYSYSSSKVTYTLVDGNGNTIKIYQTAVASEAECVAGGSIVNVEAVVSSYNGYQLLADNANIVVTGTCAHETTELIVKTAPTYTSTGVGVLQCTVCQNYVQEDVEVEKLAHPVTDYYISLDDNIGVNFVMTLAETDVVTATVAGEAVEVQIVDGTVSVEVAAAQMTDVILLFVNGMQLDASYSVRGYADVILNGEYDDYTKNLVKAMLVYGGASQTAFDHNTSNSASDGITDAPAYEMEAANEIVLSDTITALDFYGASLSYRNKIAVRFYFTADVSGYTVAAGDYTVTTGENNGLYYVEVAGILPQDLGKQITVTVTETDDSVISVSYGPMNYIERMSEKGSEAVQGLVNALFNYYKAANVYLDSLTKLPENEF